ncbi:MAG: hypothetical protein ACXITV_11810 [Luteibaculaceae bacterium]
MSKLRLVSKIISKDKLSPYLNFHNNNLIKALGHFKANLVISESFYPTLSILEIGLWNSIDLQLRKHYNTNDWFENPDFIKLVGRFQIEKISHARQTILSERKNISSGGIIAELSFGFWTSLFDTKFEKNLWKPLRLAIPNCPKEIRKRKTMSSKLNGIRKLRNRIFHYEAISWNYDVLKKYRNDILEILDWLDKDLLEWIYETDRCGQILEEFKGKMN